MRILRLAPSLVAGVVLALALTCPAAAFTDVPPGHPYEAAINTLAETEIVQGIGGGLFGLDQNVKRAQFAKMVVGAMGIIPNALLNTRFTDLGSPLTADGYPIRYVQTAYDFGITKGTNASETLFAPWQNIRRDQVVSMIVRGADGLFPGLLDDPPAGASSLFAGIGQPHGDNLRKAEYNGLLSGLVGLGSGWSVLTPATRGEVAQMLNNVVTLYKSANQSRVTVMSYNILNGAGVDTLTPENRQWVEEHGYPGDRLQKVLDIISSVSPDILGIEEAHQWELGDPAVVQEVADHLDMDWAFGQSTNPDSGFASVAFFTKFRIVESESYPEHFTRAGLRVQVETPGGLVVNVFVAHLDTNSSDTRVGEATFIVSEMAPYLDGYSIIMGDMNALAGSTSGKVFSDAGWTLCRGLASTIDQIWVSPALQAGNQPWGHISFSQALSVSDHLPSVAAIRLSE